MAHFAAAAGRELGDVEQAVDTRRELDEGAEELEARDRSCRRLPVTRRDASSCQGSFTRARRESEILSRPLSPSAGVILRICTSSSWPTATTSSDGRRGRGRAR